MIQIIKNKQIGENVYMEKLENGMTIMCIPKPNTNKKYIIWGIKYGSIDNKFVVPTTKKQIEVPNGVAHFLEHKMFEQENGTNSLDTLTALGVEANAYTTNDHTAYLFECTDNLYPALDELMNYVQHPYFTDQNVEKEKGIIGQEIMMYDDYPIWKVYLNALNNLYINNPIKIDITGTKETISKITKETLYDCYNTFYHPSNTCLVVSGNFEPEKIINEIKERVINKNSQEEIKRIYEKEPKQINKKETIANMEVSMPVFTIAIKDNIEKNMVQKHIAIEILLNIILGQSSNLYQNLYKQELIQQEPDLDYEFSRDYAHIMITGQSKNPQKLFELFQREVEQYKNNINQEDFERSKRKIYGNYVQEFNEVSDISKMFLADFFKGINSFDYIEQCQTITKQYAMEILKNVFLQENMTISIVE